MLTGGYAGLWLPADITTAVSTWVGPGVLRGVIHQRPCLNHYEKEQKMDRMGRHGADLPRPLHVAIGTGCAMQY